MTDRLRPRVTGPAEGVAKRTLYIPVDDREVWSDAQALAEDDGVSLSSMVTTALARYVEHRRQGHGDST